MCWVCHQISLIPEKVHLERKHQCLDQLCSPKLRLCSSRAKHKMNILGNLSCCKLTTVPGLHRFSGAGGDVIVQKHPLLVSFQACCSSSSFWKGNIISQSGFLKLGEKLHTNELPSNWVHEALMSQERHLVSYLGILKSIFTGCISKRGGSPSPSSMAVMPKDQTSQRAS